MTLGALLWYNGTTGMDPKNPGILLFQTQLVTPPPGYDVHNVYVGIGWEVSSVSWNTVDNGGSPEYPSDINGMYV